MYLDTSFDSLAVTAFNNIRGNTGHLVQFYENASYLIDTVSRLVGNGLAKGNSAIIIATESHRSGIEARLRERGLDLPTLNRRGRFVALDASETLAKFMDGDFPDAARFNAVVSRVVADANHAASTRFTHAFGEMVAVLWAQGRRDAALRLEALWNRLHETAHFELCCGYPLSSFSTPSDSDYLLRVCDAHSEVIPAESYAALSDSGDRRREVAYLQQKARLLESETATRKKVEAELRQKSAELAEADGRKNEILAMLGHELRNPLSAVVNAITAADLDDSRRDRSIEIVRRQSVQLSRLVDDLLDVARFTQGRICLRKKPIRLIDVIERAIEASRPAVETRRQRLVMVAPPDTRGILVDADPARLQQIIGNLIHNASKFTPARGHIEVSTRRQAGEVAIRVRDTGIGITSALLPHVFDLFAQGDVALDRAQGGLGIGLTLAKQLVELHRGRIEAHSSGLGAGSEFLVLLPMVKKRSETPDESNRTAKAGSRVLIVEDNIDAADSMFMLLEMLGHDPKVASDGFVALEVLAQETFDVVLVDIGLPAMDGYTLAGRIRQLPTGKVMRLVALTGYGQDEDRRRALDAGFDDHLVKPADIDRLQTLLAESASS